jgi:hypothetical protein
MTLTAIKKKYDRSSIHGPFLFPPLFYLLFVEQRFYLVHYDYYE